MNVTSLITVVYENKWQRTLGENEPKQSQFQTRNGNFVLDISDNFLYHFISNEGAAQMLISKLLR